MKHLVKKLCFYGLLLMPVFGCLGYLYHEELTRTAEARWHHFKRNRQHEAIKKYGAGLPPVNEVRLLRLTDLAPANPRGTYRLHHEKTTIMHIADEISLTGEAAQAMARLWRNLRLHTDYMPACFDPHHVVEFRKDDSLVAEAVVCFECGNTTLPDFLSPALVSFESALPHESPEYLDFRQQVETLVGKASAEEK